MRAAGSTLELRACLSSCFQLCSVLLVGLNNCASFHDDIDIQAQFGISSSFWHDFVHDISSRLGPVGPRIYLFCFFFF